MQSSDGSSQISATINAPENRYAEYATHGLVNGKLHIFGGTSDYKKVVYFVKNSFLSVISKNNRFFNRN